MSVQRVDREGTHGRRDKPTMAASWERVRIRIRIKYIRLKEHKVSVANFLVLPHFFN